VEEVYGRLFPGARLARWIGHDEPSGYQRILRTLGSGDIDILVGTQMMLKATLSQIITLVGVCQPMRRSAIPDFRAP